MSGNLSLKQLLEKSLKHEELNKTKTVFSQEAGYDKFEVLEMKYPTKLTDQVLETFRGAQVNGKNKNLQGQIMKNYIKSLDEPDFSEQPVLFEAMEDIKDVNLEAFDTVVLYVKNGDLDYLDYVVNLVSLSDKLNFAAMVILDDEKDYRRLVYKLGYWEEEKKVKVCSIFFKNELKNKAEDVMLTFSVVFGKFCVSSPPLKSFYENMESSLRYVVASISPVAAKIACATSLKCFPGIVHAATNTNYSQVTYFAPKINLDKFKLKAALNALVDVENDDLKVSEDDSEVVEDNLEAVDNRNVETLPHDEVLREVINCSGETVLEKQSSTSSTKY